MGLTFFIIIIIIIIISSEILINCDQPQCRYAQHKMCNATLSSLFGAARVAVACSVLDVNFYR